ncbi:hypothetical protein COT94_04340 [Candidatus Falkowbacteria bacterium CG10_big_fil_rev_8_21_14_0_10_37_14]|uniref:Undecaprenyl-phosphate alpha-N-acetylglucosaminyl 1-phosphate transferase n=1 Tax=Candidatus Falkowbacteria bacterium CG10_big_fil_rev_8_21_14_0_10_37_14 TaxID=1974561 RepID=A0A2M6WSU4_9BACT|nr:undecaprenyl/decaprenyl-phosphate alpha-N-acetylglucosaminyl 1-phosphate transferase [Candidatus Falkowbacteria bacterium]PIT95786.1 MAG: hypothetical protein COT94_04340 [Candidatus Falkowbacteria bacterium CG10_big_fil_rev_8_21_14_0_10_37_14]
MIITYIVGSLLSFLLAAVLTVGIEKLAWHYKLLDWPRERHAHSKPTPLAGGVAIFLSTVIVLILSYRYVSAGNLTMYHWLGVLAGGGILVLGGVLDDKYELSPMKQLAFPLLAILAVLAGGVNIEKITNPFGGFVYLSDWLSALIISLWLLGMMYTTKLLDGVDGLVSGVGVIGALIIFLFTITTRWYQPDIAWVALIFAGAVAGFWLRNWAPAKIFLGESGSLLIGFVLGVLSIISGGKIALALLIMGVPILDVAWTIIRRLWAGSNPFRSSDRKHLHYRLMDVGLSPQQTSLVFYVFALFFGLSALFLQSKGKLSALGLLLLVAAGLIIGLNWLLDKKRQKS